MKNLNDILTKIYSVLIIISTIGFYILSTIIYVYTIYYYAVHNGILGAFLSLCLPVISSIYLFFDLIPQEGLINGFSIMLFIYIICFGIMAILTFSDKKSST